MLRFLEKWMLWYDKKEGVVSMDYQERLKNLPPEVMTAFSESFIFLISNDKVQHFPARDLKIGRAHV